MHPNPNHAGASRREFLQAGVAGLAAAGFVGPARADETAKNDSGIPLRPFGRHADEQVTMIALGGHHIGRSQDEKDDIALIQMAVNEGITFLDNAWDYHDGGSEQRMGKALEQGKLRDKVFLMTKVCGRDAETARQHLDDSLRRLRTDRIDLWQFHEINYDNDPDLIFAEGGAFEVALKARDEGKVRYIGFTGHKDPHIHLKMLGMPKQMGRDDFEWDSVQMPLTVLDGRYRSFQHQVLPVLLDRGIAPIGMKSLGGGGSVKGGVIPTGTGLSAEQCRRYVWSLPIASLVCGIDAPEILQQDLEFVRNFTPLSEAERTELEEGVALVAGDGRFERYKSTNLYDGPYHREQHNFPAEIG